ncbi:hypothetical protein [Sinorhizobium meliloti]|uniref:hypothetical protein n=1 Tax=Rhizobium meliloti TaxID=382 RepID=UPI000FD7D3D0|nr:hypothetical protein [Sinorhizobium meliloti]RVH21446.1 hypothetical protein CN216_00290 [Sinorhizobium meliloti]RVH21507.1 hypothetical protein CN216_00610 [Sinorhizobium meliloti]
MPITFGAFCAAIQRSLSARLREEAALRARAEQKRLKREAEEAEWRAELQRREAAKERIAERAAEKQAKAAQEKDERLALMDAAAARGLAKLLAAEQDS